MCGDNQIYYMRLVRPSALRAGVFFRLYFLHNKDQAMSDPCDYHCLIWLLPDVKIIRKLPPRGV